MTTDHGTVTTVGVYVEEYAKAHLGNLPFPDLSTDAKALRALYLVLRYGGSASKDRDEGFLQPLPAMERHALVLLEEWWTLPRMDDILESKTKPLVILQAILNGPSRRDERSRWIQHLGELAPPSDQPFFQVSEHILSDQDDSSKATEKSELSSARSSLEWAYHVLVQDDMPEDVFDPAEYKIRGISYYHMRMLLLSKILAKPSYDSGELSWWVNTISSRAAAERIAHSCWQKWRNANESAQRVGHAEHILFKNIHQGLEAVPKPCFWLEDTSKDPTGGLPYFLWDIEQERTIETRHLDRSEISYAIVSYSWGRWRKPGNGTFMPGLPSWLVPENTRFEVTSLPGIFKRLGLRERYIWFDIFCIPQDVTTDETLAKICQRELARQAAIFQGADTALAWLNDVSNWADLRSNLEYMALAYLRNSVSYEYSIRRSETVERMTAIVAGEPDTASAASGLTVDSEDGKPSPAGWFTSLWTLQEAIMRPDMILCNQNWEPLCVGADSMPISFNYMLALGDADMSLRGAHLYGLKSSKAARTTNSWNENRPSGVRALERFTTDMGLENFDDLTPISPLVLGSTRKCTSSRAEAIMSVCGATNWHLGKTVSQFQQGHELKEGKDSLVGGLYPVEFIREVYTKTGADFFLHMHRVVTLRFDRTHSSDAPPTIVRGSMLPFISEGLGESDGPGGFMSRAPASTFTTETHSALKKWLIQADSSVSILTAGVVASKCELATALPLRYKVPDDAKFTIIGNPPDDTYGQRIVLRRSEELLDWVRRYDGEVHAICCKWSKYQVRGIIIQRVNSMEASTFVRVATFYPNPFLPKDKEYEFPESVPVNWRVL